MFDIQAGASCTGNRISLVQGQLGSRPFVQHRAAVWRTGGARVTSV
jgi:hypothetical protein